MLQLLGQMATETDYSLSELNSRETACRVILPSDSSYDDAEVIDIKQKEYVTRKEITAEQKKKICNSIKRGFYSQLLDEKLLEREQYEQLMRSCINSNQIYSLS